MRVEEFLCMYIIREFPSFPVSVLKCPYLYKLYILRVGGVESALDMSVTVAARLRAALGSLASSEQLERRLDVVASLEHKVVREDVQARVLHLVIVSGVPAVEMQLDAVVLHGRYGRSSDQCGTSAIHRRQPHANFEMNCLTLQKAK